MLSIEELRKLSELARIGVPDSELEELREQLEKILEFVSRVQQADVAGVGEVTVPEHHNIFREDGEAHVVGKYTEAIVANFSDKHSGFLRVKKIIDK